MTTRPPGTARSPVRCLCDRCGRTFWINELSVHDGQAVCNECAGMANASAPVPLVVEHTEEQRRWMTRRAYLHARFEQEWDAALAEVKRPLAMLYEVSGQPGNGTMLSAEQWREAMAKVSPDALAAADAYRQAMRELGPYPLGGRLVRAPDWGPRELTPTAQRVAAYWAGA